MRSKRPGRYSICQLSSAPISWRSPPQHGQARSFPPQLVDLRGYRKILEIDQRAPSRPPLYPPPLGRGLSPHGSILRVDRFLLQLLAEVQQRLRQLPARFQAVRPRPVVPLLVAFQLQLQTQCLHVEIVGTLSLLRRPRGLLVGPLLLAVALGQRRKQQGFQRRGVFRQGGKRWVRGRHITLDVAIRMWLHRSRIFSREIVSSRMASAPRLAFYPAPRW